MSGIGRELQLTLQAAYREALARRHADLTIEHLLFALLHDTRGVEVLRHTGADLALLKRSLKRFFEEDLEQLPEGEEGTRQTLAFHRVLQHAIHHAESAEKDEIEAGDLLAAIFQEPDSHAVALLREQGVSRLDILRFLSHGTSKLGTAGNGGLPRVDGDATNREGATPAGARPGAGGDDLEMPEDPLRAFASNLSERAAAGTIDPLVGRDAELERAIHVLARRRKNNPIFVGETGVGKTALAEGLAQRIHEGRVPEDLRDAEIFALDLGALLAGPAIAATSRRASRPSSRVCNNVRSPSSSSTRSTPSSAPGPPRAARSTHRICSSRCSPAANCAAWARRPIASIATSIEIGRWPGVSNASTSWSRRSRRRSGSCRASLRATRSTTVSATPAARYAPRSSSRRGI